MAVSVLLCGLAPSAAWADDPQARAAAGDPEGDAIDFAQAEADARHMLYRRDVELLAGTPPADAVRVMSAELLYGEYLFPSFFHPFAPGLEQSAWTPAMAESLVITLETDRAEGDFGDLAGLNAMWHRLTALDDVPRWALECRWALLGGPRDPTPCQKLAETHAVAHGWADRRVTRLQAFARAIADGRGIQGPLEPAPLDRLDRIRAGEANGRLALDAFDRQIAADMTPLQAAGVLARQRAGELNLSPLGVPLPADAGAWSPAVAEAVVLRAWLGRMSADVVEAYGGLPPIEGRALRADPDALFGALPLWSALDPPDGPDDVPALAARCRMARIAAAGDPEASRAPCAALAGLFERAAGPLDPQVQAYRAAAGLPHDRALAELTRPPIAEREGGMDPMLFELAGQALTWDAEVAAGTPIARIPGVMARYRTFEWYGLGPQLIGPPPDGGAWPPALVDGVVATIIEGQLGGDPRTGIGGLDAWSAMVSGPRGGPERWDVPALTARCRAALMRWQVGPTAPDPIPCAALADALEAGIGPLHHDTVGARLRAVALSVDDEGMLAEQQAALDAPWADAADPETRRARARLVGLGDPEADLVRESYVDFFDVDSEELLDEWARDLDAGLDADRAAAAVAERARDWLRTVSVGLQPPFPADAGAWPAPMVEGLVSVAEIGRRLGRADWYFGMQPALARARRAAAPERDVPALSARCRAADIEASEGRPTDDIEACERIHFAEAAALGALHPRLTDHRLRLARLHTARGERAAAAEWWAEALALWTDPAGVDTPNEALWRAAQGLRAWGESLAAIGEHRRAAAIMAEGRSLAETTGYARVGDGLRFLGEELRVLAEAGDRDAALARFEAIGDELNSLLERLEARQAADEIEGGWDDARAMALAGASMGLDVMLALDRLKPANADVVALMALAEAGWLQLEEAGLSAHPLAVELLAALARLRGGLTGEAQRDRARDESRRALALQATLDRRTRPWVAPMAAAVVARHDGRPDVAIAWAKEAVDAAQAARGEVGALGPAAEQRFVEARIELYTALGGWLIEAGRLAEADEVERRVGALRLAGLTRASTATVAREPVSRSGAEKTWRRRYTGAAGRLRGGLLDREGFIGALDGAERRLLADTRRTDVPDAEADRGLAERLQRMQRAALLQVVLGDDRLHLVLSMAAGRSIYSRPIARGEMNARAYAFYQALRSGAPQAKIDRQARALYADLIEPVELALRARGVETLMVAPGGALRYVPFGALQDADGDFAVESWAIVRYPVLSPELLDGPPRRPACLAAVDAAGECVAAFGARVHGDGLGNLAFVPAELEGIVRRRVGDLDGPVGGVVYLDRAFTADALRGALTRGVPLVHVASHFVFHPGSATRSFLALGGGARLDLQRLAGPDFPFDRVDLLTLSACETAVGTFAAGQPPDSFAALALGKGAGAVLASLWPVADDSTATLMRAFYGHLAGGASKAQALRRAQLELMRGPAPGGASRKFGLPGVEVATGAHPYAWAPFVLTGDWR